MGGGVRAGVGLLHAYLSACWPTALVLPLCPLPLPCVSSGLLVLPVAVCTARSCQHWLLVKLGACLLDCMPGLLLWRFPCALCLCPVCLLGCSYCLLLPVLLVPANTGY